MRYDATAGQLIQNWPGACYSAKMTIKDGSALTALFKLKWPLPPSAPAMQRSHLDAPARHASEVERR